jgi:hypothetical protein
MFRHALVLFGLLLAGSPLPGGEPSPTGQAAVPIQVARIDELIANTWRDFEIQPAKAVDDATWCRRVFLDVIGRIPRSDELREFLDSHATDKRTQLVERLLHEERYTAEYAGHWATVWSNVLIGRSGGSDARSLTNRDGLQKYLRDSFAVNKPYDKLVHELVTATGTNKPGAADFNGAVNFLSEKVNDDNAVLATSSTSRIFLGQQVQCTQCHNHPFNQWKQQKFWEFNSFFRQTRALRRYVDGGNDIDHVELIDQDFAGEAGDPNDALIFYELRNGLTRVAYPVFVDGTAIGVSGFVNDVNRRAELGRLMINSTDLDKTIVNRMWSLFLGYGFTKPIDDLGPHQPISHAELLDYLSQQFREQSFDLKKLITWIALSRPYSLQATLGPANEIDDPTIGEPPKFSRFYIRQMSAEQLYRSLITASGAATSGSYEQQAEQQRQWLSQFVIAFGTDEGDEATTFNGSIPQALMLFNGELTQHATQTVAGSFLDQVSRLGRTPRDRVTELFVAGLARRPNKQELALASKLLVARQGNELEMLQDMWWAILNSNEFVMQH